MPANIMALFGGNPDIVPLLDGEARAAQASLLAAFSREAVAGYLRASRAGSKRCWRMDAKGQGPVTAEPEDGRSGVSDPIFGRAPGEQLSRLLADGEILGKAFVALPINLPGTAYQTA